MANTKISALTSLGATPASGDLFSIVDVSDTTQAASGSTKKVTAAYIAVTDGSVATLTGGGTISLGGFTLTVPATGTVALRGAANTFTTAQTITPSSNVIGLTINMPASNSTHALTMYYNGTYYGGMFARSGVSGAEIVSNDLGNTVAAPYVLIGRNSNATVPSAATLRMAAKDGTVCYYWTDGSANLRISTSAAPTSTANDTGLGIVVGTQTSSLDSKDISDTLPDAQEAYQHILNAARNGLRAWSYKNKAYNGEFFPNGIVTDYAPRYGMDRDEDHPNGKSLNPPVAIGDLMASILVISERLDKLEAQNG